MANYIRPRISGASIFFTVNLADRSSCVLVDHIAFLRMAVRQTKTERPFRIDAWVVLPNHMHMVWTLPDGDCDYSTRIGAIKARFTMGLRRAGFSPPSTSLPTVKSGRYAGLKPGLRQGKREQPIWQRRFWEHHIRNASEFNAYVSYCHHNPVKHGFVERPEDWPFSTIHRRAGLSPP